MTTYQEDLHLRFKKGFIIEAANFFSEFFLQIKGIPMGTVLASTYAKLTVGYHENKFHSVIHQSYSLASRFFENSGSDF